MHGLASSKEECAPLQGNARRRVNQPPGSRGRPARPPDQCSGRADFQGLVGHDALDSVSQAIAATKKKGLQLFAATPSRWCRRGDSKYLQNYLSEIFRLSCRLKQISGAVCTRTLYQSYSPRGTRIQAPLSGAYFQKFGNFDHTTFIPPVPWPAWQAGL